MASTTKSQARHSIINNPAPDLERILRRNKALDAKERERVRRETAEMDQPMTKRRLDNIFGAINRALANLERTGRVQVADDGAPIFYPFAREGAYPLLPALTSLVETFTQIASTSLTDGLADLRNKMASNQRVTALDIGGARSAVASMRKVCAKLTPNEFLYQIKLTEARAFMVAQLEASPAQAEPQSLAA